MHHARLAAVAGFLGPSILLAAGLSVAFQQTPRGLDPSPTFTNSIGMPFVRIEPGLFLMGSEDGDLDEQPVHQVAITRPFYLSAHEVTNAAYEQFDPGHRSLRGKLAYSTRDDDAVVFVSWDDAVAFTRWLSDREGRTYRLPTEAEWEYAARAGTTTRYSTGDDLPAGVPKNAGVSWHPNSTLTSDVVRLAVGLSAPNPWGLFDMHGNVEEWTLDWYGPYERSGQVDPVGRADGDFRVTRGGSHSTEPVYLRSANRMAALPADRHWLIGFRVLLGEPPETEPLPVAPHTELHQHGVDLTTPRDRDQAPDPAVPYLAGPRLYQKLRATERGPFFDHNWTPALTEMPNGDLLAVWTTGDPLSRQTTQAASRLRYGADAWEPASVFWDTPDRHDHNAALWWDGDQTVHHVAGLSAAATYGNVAIVLRTSTDSGRSWSKARLIDPEHTTQGGPHLLFDWPDGTLVRTVDDVSASRTFLDLSRDGGRTWSRSAGAASGIHAPVVRLPDGRLLAFGRTGAVRGRMPRSTSTDEGRSWTVTDSPFPPIGSSQRPVLLRLASGELFFASFTEGQVFVDEDGREFPGSGLFGALSTDDGETWPYQRLIVPGGPPQWLPYHRMRRWGFTVSDQTAEPAAYLAATQARNGVIHLITAAYHYAFNVAWLKTAPPAPRLDPLPIRDRLAGDAGEAAADLARGWSGRMRFEGEGTRDTDVLTVEPTGAVRLQVPDGGRPFTWRDDGPDGFGAARAAVGATIDITAEVHGPEAELEITADAGHGRVYRISLLPGEVLVRGVPIPRRLDNATAAHRFRMAVTADGLLYVYRDGELLALRSPIAVQARSDPFLTVGGGPGLAATIHEIRYDLTGAYAPSTDSSRARFP